jgi:hypothetical protein
MSMKKVLAAIVAVVVAIVAFILRPIRRKSGHKKVSAPPKNTAATAALDDVQESLEEELDRIKAATDGDSPADDLADLANARRR